MITAIYGQYDEFDHFLFRSWQSMKERFRKKILPVIHISFRKVLTKESLDNFEKYAKGMKVDTPPSTENSEDESIEREMNQALAQSTPITSRCSFTSFWSVFMCSGFFNSTCSAKKQLLLTTTILTIKIRSS